MFLIEDERGGATYLVFTCEDPRKHGYTGKVAEGVSLDYDEDAVHSWPSGGDAPEAFVGQAPDNPRHYKVFKHSRERQSAHYRPVSGNPVLLGSWSDYVKSPRS